MRISIIIVLLDKQKHRVQWNAAAARALKTKLTSGVFANNRLLFAILLLFVSNENKTHENFQTSLFTHPQPRYYYCLVVVTWWWLLSTTTTTTTRLKDDGSCNGDNNTAISGGQGVLKSTREVEKKLCGRTGAGPSLSLSLTHSLCVFVVSRMAVCQ